MLKTAKENFKKGEKMKKILAVVAIFLALNTGLNAQESESKMLNNGMIVRISEIEVHPQFLDEYLLFAKQVAEASVLDEEGVISIYPMQVLEDKTQIRILEIYKDEKSYKSHIASAHFKKYKEGTLHMVKHLKLVDTKELAPENFKRIFKKAD